MDPAAVSEQCNGAIDALTEAIVADRRFFEHLFVGILAGGHVLIEDVPGTGKTLTARSVATVLGLSFARVQLTPDLLPADITGTQVFDSQDERFEFREGPLFANVVLADELNRAPPKTQAALLEAMAEGQVTVDTETHQLPTPFLVIATQNPIEASGTFELPAAQRDRFLMELELGYPDRNGERTLLQRRLSRKATRPTVGEYLDAGQIEAFRSVVEDTRVDDDVLEFILDVTRATRSTYTVETGISPRGTQRLLEASRALATLAGRDYVVPDDVVRLAQPVLAHRIVLTPESTVEGVEQRAVVRDILEDVPVPTVDR